MTTEECMKRAAQNVTTLDRRFDMNVRLLLTFLAVILALGPVGWGRTVAAQAPARQAPTFQVDPSWPKVPSKWVLGLVSGVNVDAQDHVWVIHRPRTVKPEDKAKAAPPVLEF